MTMTDLDGAALSRALELARLGDRSAIPVLLARITDEDVGPRHVASRALAEHRELILEPTALPALVRCLELANAEIESCPDDDMIGRAFYDPRPAAIGSFNNLRGASAIPELLDLAECSGFSDAAINGLVGIGLSAAESLLKRLRAANGPLRVYREAICRLRNVAVLEELFNESGIEATALALRRAQLNGRGDSGGQTDFTETLGWTWGERLVAASSSSETAVRSAVANLLGDIGDCRAVPTLLELLQDPEHAVSVMASLSLGLLAEPHSIPALLDALATERGMLLERAFGSLGNEGLLALRAARRDDRPAVRDVAQKLLGLLDD